MRSLAKSFLPSIALLAAALLLGLIAIGDHWYKQRRIDRAELAQWYCFHVGSDCTTGRWQTMEAHWQKRQVGYEIGVTLLAAGAVFAAVRTARRPGPLKA